MENLRRWFRRRVKEPPRDSSSLTSSPAAPPRRKTFPSGIKLFHTTQNSAVDIIFVHGLTGDCENTWTAKGAAPWPKAILPTKIANARILTFGYDAYVADWRSVSQNRIGNHSNNLLNAIATYRENDDTNDHPIIFVAHSLGGLVCEDALLASRQRPEKHLRNVFLCTRGIIFLGTPHHGSGLAKYAEMLAQTIGLTKQTNPDIVRVLRADSEVLARIQDNFHAMIRAMKQGGMRPVEITCFYEELPVPGIGSVVPFDSAVLPGYTSIGIHGNHMDMTKYKSEDDPGFIAVTGELRRWIKELTNLSGDGQLNIQELPFELPQTSGEREFQSIWRGSDQGRLSRYRKNDYGRTEKPSNRCEKYLMDAEATSNCPSKNYNDSLRPTRQEEDKAKSYTRGRSDIATQRNNVYGDHRENHRYDATPRFRVSDRFDYASFNQVFEVPLPNNPRFIGQTALIAEVDRVLEESLHSSSLGRVILTGLGGSGKTELAIQFAYLFRNEFFGVFWADATSEASLHSSFDRLHQRMKNFAAPKLRSRSPIRREGAFSESRTFSQSRVDVDSAQEDIAEFQPRLAKSSDFVDWLAHLPRFWLLVVDNMDDPDMVATLEKILSRFHRGFVIVTTRNRGAAKLGDQIEVSGMSRQDSAELLLRSINQGAIRTATNVSLANTLVEKLGDLPLAIDQAAAYINFCELSIDEYLSLFESEASYLLGKASENRYHNTKSEYDDRYDTVLKTWEISFRHVKRSHTGASTLLQLFAFMNHENIQEKIFTNIRFPPQMQWSALGDLSEFDAIGFHIPTLLIQCLNSKHYFMESFGILLKFSLVKRRSDSKSLCIHPLVHYWTFFRMTEIEKSQWLLTTMALLGVAIPLEQQLPALESSDLSQDIIPHVRTLFDFIPKVRIIPGIRNLVPVLYSVPYCADNTTLHRLCDQLEHVSLIAQDQFLNHATMLWKLTGACLRKPLCCPWTNSLILDAIGCVVDMSRKRCEEGGINALLLRMAFVLGQTLEERGCDASRKKQPHDPCIKDTSRSSVGIIGEFVSQWSPVNESVSQMESQAVKLREIYLFAITSLDLGQDMSTSIKEQKLKENLQEFASVKSIRVPVLKKLASISLKEGRSVECSLRDAKYLMEESKSVAAEVFREVSFAIATTFLRMIDSSEIGPGASCGITIPWEKPIDFLKSVRQWEQSIGPPVTFNR